MFTTPYEYYLFKSGKSFIACKNKLNEDDLMFEVNEDDLALWSRPSGIYDVLSIDSVNFIKSTDTDE